MLVIRETQLSELRQSVEPDFCRQICEYLRGRYNATVSKYDDKLLEQMVGSGVERARRHGLIMQSNITFFVTLMFEFAPNFDEHSRIREIFSNKYRTPDQNVDTIPQSVSEEDWTEIEQMSDDSAWRS